MNVEQDSKAQQCCNNCSEQNCKKATRSIIRLLCCSTSFLVTRSRTSCTVTVACGRIVAAAAKINPSYSPSSASVPHLPMTIISVRYPAVWFMCQVLVAWEALQYRQVSASPAQTSGNATSNACSRRSSILWSRIFTARRYASAVRAMAPCLCLSVCLSVYVPVRLSQVGVLSKLTKGSSWFWHMGFRVTPCYTKIRVYTK